VSESTGYLAAPVPIIKAAARLQGQISSCASSISQFAGIAALRTHDELMAGARRGARRGGAACAGEAAGGLAGRPARARDSLEARARSCARVPTDRRFAFPLHARARLPVPARAGHVAELRAKRDLGLELLRAIPHVLCPKPEGAFYLLPDVSAYFGRAAPDGTTIASAEALCVHLLKEYKVRAAACLPIT
jgi:aspartate/methionine/tyrosine aminotransferase